MSDRNGTTVAAGTAETVDGVDVARLEMRNGTSSALERMLRSKNSAKESCALHSTLRCATWTDSAMQPSHETVTDCRNGGLKPRRVRVPVVIPPCGPLGMSREQLIRHLGHENKHMEKEKLRVKMWCEQTLRPDNTDKV